MKPLPYEKNVCSKMSFSDLSNFLEQVYFEKDEQVDVGFYASFLQHEDAIKRRIKEMKGTRAFYILESKLDQIYNCDSCEY